MHERRTVELTDQMLNNFKLPLDPRFLGDEPTEETDNICVVALIGQSRLGTSSKFSLISSFNSAQNAASTEDLLSQDQKCSIEGSYDSSCRTLYLHLKSTQDMKTMAQLCSSHLADIETKEDFDKLMQTSEYDCTRALILLFSLSHIILVYNAGTSFDVNLIKVFHVVDTIRLKLLPHMTDILRSLHLPKDWVNAGRLCAPRLLFIFQSCLLPNEEKSIISKGRSQKIPPVKRLQHAMEDQIYRILRKARIITNISNNSLFAIPVNQEYVFLLEKEAVVRNQPFDFFIHQLTQKCADDSYCPTFDQQQPSGTPGLFVHSPNHSFEGFLAEHVELALTKGFDDNMGRNPVPPIFESPTLHAWFKASDAIYNFLFEESSDSRTKSHFTLLKNLLNTNSRFSEGRCIKVLPLAEKAYQEGLPHHYTQAEHLAMLAQAKNVFLQHARGPACQQYLAQLEADCTKFWENGHQMCEHQSLTGNQCINELHRLPNDPETDSNAHLPEMEHCSQVKCRAACSCGRRQADRDDPFDYKTANYDWYDKLSSSCCKTLESIPMPVFVPSTSDVRPGTSRPPMLSRSPMGSPHKTDSLLSTAMAHLSIGLSLGQSSGTRSMDSEAQDTFNPEASQDQAIPSPSSPPLPLELELQDEGADFTRQHSTTEYLPGMVHSQSAPGLLPKFSSWSMILLAKSYSPSAGLDQPGFFHYTSYLLPWDIVTHGSESWPVASKKYKQPRKAHKSDGSSASVVRFHIGLEYECPRGHRLFLSTPEKIFKAPASGIFKETASKIVHNDMPLYTACHCSRSGKTFMAQLTRLFVGIPESYQHHVAVNPRVQPAGSAPVFHPHVEGPVTLKPGLWVIRFPYIYYADGVHYPMPSDPMQLSACRLFKDYVTVSEISSKE